MDIDEIWVACIREYMHVLQKSYINKSKASKTKMQKEYNHKLINLRSFLCLLKYLTKPL